MTTIDDFNRGLLKFIGESPTPFHAVENSLQQLMDAGYTRLQEDESWSLEPSGRYVVTRNDSSLIAFELGEESPVDNGFRMVGAHTDSPCLKVKPRPELADHGYIRLGVEVYGGVLLNPWFDRDLSLAGRASLLLDDGRLIHRLINFRRPVAVIPSLAIHLDREANENRSINKQTDLPPILSLGGESPFNLRASLKEFLQRDDKALAGAKVLDYELYFYDSQPPAIIGWNDEFIAGARLDNLLSCYSGLRALLQSEDSHSRLLVCNDHEEVGSGSTAGARGNFLRSILERIAGGDEAYAKMLSRSCLISTDNAHGIHPNFADKHDCRHGPLLNAGPVIKVNSNQAYASNSETISLFLKAAEEAGINTQSFVNRSDMACGSTIGPLTATMLGVRTVDVGVPTFGMHSVRELAGSEDALKLSQILRAFYMLPSLEVSSAL